MEDLEAGILYQQPKSSNKKMKKRKQLDALLKFRPNGRNNNRLSNNSLLSSEDDLFLPDQQSKLKKPYSSSYRRCFSYTRNILSFCFVCIFMIICVGLAYANIELKTEVQNLSSRVSEIEKRFSSAEINRIVTMIDQMKVRLNIIERWNISYINERLHRLQVDFQQIRNNHNFNQIGSTESSMNDEDLSSKLDKIEQKSKDFSDVATELEKLSRDADTQNKQSKEFNRDEISHLLEQERRLRIHQNADQLMKVVRSLNETFYTNSIQWQNRFNLLKDEIKTSNTTMYIHQLFDLVQNSSNITMMKIAAFQTELNQLRIELDACKCSKESTYHKPSVVDTDQLSQSLVTKSSDNEENLTHNKTIDIAQLVQ